MSNETQKLESLLLEHYTPKLNKYGDSHLSVDWGSKATQDLRFKILLEPFSGKTETRSILDVGCGLGHLYTYIRDNKLAFDYHGIDAIEAMVSEARKRHPENEAAFEVSQLTEKQTEKYDIVVASGIFYVGCDEKRMFNEIKTMFELANHGIAFNSLSSWASKKEEGEFYADPVKVLDYCHTLSPRCIIRHDYMTHDFTVQLFTECGAREYAEYKC